MKHRRVGVHRIERTASSLVPSRARRFRRVAGVALPFGAAIIACLAAPACQRQRATPQDCSSIVDRIVELELVERGFRDPVLLDRKQRGLRATLAADLTQCAGKPIKGGALDCVRAAKSTEALSHQCLR